jgi:hypothetical protein
MSKALIMRWRLTRNAGLSVPHYGSCSSNTDKNKESMKAHGFLLYEQKWFPGVHGDVGGGHKFTGLSDCALEWMANCAERHGMKVDLNLVKDDLHDPDVWSGRVSQEVFRSGGGRSCINVSGL